MKRLLTPRDAHRSKPEKDCVLINVKLHKFQSIVWLLILFLTVYWLTYVGCDNAPEMFAELRLL